MAAKKSTKKSTAKSTKSSGISNTQKVGIGVGITAAALAAAGGYFLYGSKDAKANRTKVKSWTLKAKADVLETLEGVENMSQAEYEKLVESVSAGYARLKNASKADIATFKREMKQYWPEIEKAGKSLEKKANSAKKSTKKVVNKTAKKVAKKTSKK